MMSRTTGFHLQDEVEHISQAIQDILTTPLGSRIMRRNYGSLLPQLISTPFNDVNRMQLFAATATALIQWEDRINLESIAIEFVEQGKFVIELGLTLANNNQKESLSIPLNFGAIA